jgi:predicted nucleic acid-binding protein
MVIFDTSTLILLAKAEILRDVLEKMEAAIPDVVRREATLLRERLDAQLIGRCIEEELIQVLGQKGIRKADVTRMMQDFRLAEGEATALLFAQRQNGSLATDDGPAMKACKVLGVPFVTAINLLVHAVQKKWIPKEIALARLETLHRAGRYEIRIVQDARERIRVIGG